jgi:hypothetical protein
MGTRSASLAVATATAASARASKTAMQARNRLGMDAGRRAARALVRTGSRQIRARSARSVGVEAAETDQRQLPATPRRDDTFTRV